MLKERTAQQLRTELANYIASSLNNPIGCCALVSI